MILSRIRRKREGYLLHQISTRRYQVHVAEELLLYGLHLSVALLLSHL